MNKILCYLLLSFSENRKIINSFSFVEKVYYKQLIHWVLFLVRNFLHCELLSKELLALGIFANKWTLINHSNVYCHLSVYKVAKCYYLSYQKNDFHKICVKSFSTKLGSFSSDISQVALVRSEIANSDRENEG